MTQATLPFADDTPTTVAPYAPDRCGFGLGWDHARHGLLPPAQHLLPQNPLRQGWEAGSAGGSSGGCGFSGTGASYQEPSSRTKSRPMSRQ